MKNVKKRKCRFKGLHDVSAGELLAGIIKDNETNNPWKNRFVFVKTIFLWTFFYSNSFNLVNNGNVMFFLSELNSRKDYKDYMLRAAELCDNRVVVQHKRRMVPHFTYLFFLLLLNGWNKELKRAGVNSAANRRICLVHLYRAYINYKEITNYIYKKKLNVKCFVVWCDILLSDSVLVQKMKHMGIDTVTFQHGIYLASSHARLFTKSKSDMMFSINQFTIEESKKCDYRGQTVLTGHPERIGRQEAEKKLGDKAATIGVLLDSFIYHDLNIEFAGFMNQYCLDNGKCMIIKLHPTERDDKSKYLKKLSSSVCKGVYCSEISLNDFSKMIDIAVVRLSSTLVNMLDSGVPSFSFARNIPLQADTYKNIKQDIRFSTEEDLNRLISKVESGDYKDEFEEIRSFFCVDDVSKRYRDFFEKYQNGMSGECKE